MSRLVRTRVFIGRNTPRRRKETVMKVEMLSSSCRGSSFSHRSLEVIPSTRQQIEYEKTVVKHINSSLNLSG